MFRWVPYAMVRISLFFMGGITLAFYAPDLLSERTCILLIGCLAATYFLFRVFRIQTKYRVVEGAVALSFVFAIGYLNVLLHTDSRRSDHLIHVKEPVDYYEVIVTRYPEEKEKSWKLEGRVNKTRSGEVWHHVNGNVMLYFSKADFPTSPGYGDVFLVRGSPTELSEPGNPGEFNYKRFLASRKIYHQCFVGRGNAVRIHQQPPSQLMAWAIQSRQWADNKLKSAVPGEREGAIASALVLGVTDGLDNELLQAYSATGSLHVLAVSGLHVGIIYTILLFLLRPLNKSQKGKWLLAAIAVVVLWAYAFVTGLSPSVLRAVTMFTFVALARPWKQTANIYNTLAASAFCLLVYEPYLLLSVGFQLSYLAVLGIVFLQPLIYPRFTPASRFWDEVWKITCVSIAAQLATYPLGLLYFHQFPNYFLLSNLLVIPASTLVLVEGLAALAVSFVEPLFIGLGIVLKYTIQFMNLVVFAVESLPYSLIDEIYISLVQCVLLFLATLTLVLVFSNRRYSFLPISFVLFLIFAALEWNHVITNESVQKFTIYLVKGHFAMDLIDHQQTSFVADKALQRDGELTRYHVAPNRLFHGVEHVDSLQAIKTFDGFTVFAWKGEVFVRIFKRNAKLPNNLKADWLIVSDNSLRSLKELNTKVTFDQLILDSSNSFYFADRLLKEAKSQRINVHSVLHEGAYSYSLEL